MKRVIVILGIIAIFLGALPALAGQHYGVPDSVDALLSEMLEAINETTREAQALQRELRDINSRRWRPEEKDEMRARRADLEREIRRTWDKRGCLGRVYDEAKTDWRRISRSWNPLNKIIDSSTWEMTWKNRFEDCGR